MSPKELSQLRERISKQSDEDLLKIVNVDFKDYRKETVGFAKAELEKRDLARRTSISPTLTGTLPQEQASKQVELSPNGETTECKFCNSVISATATECEGCGYGTPYGIKLEAEQELQEALVRDTITLINCPACQLEVSNQAAACPKCGQPIKAPPPVKVSSAKTFIPLKKKPSYTAGKIIGIGALGLLIGGAIGFALRPSVPFIGQLPFEVVITQGANLKGLDQILISKARESFTYLVAGAILGAISGGIIGALLSKRKS
jgi:hypothetical protein